MEAGASGRVSVVARKAFRKRQDYQNELEILINAGDHPNIVEWLGFSHQQMIIELEYARLGDLWEYVVNHGRLSRNQLAHMMQQVSSAVEHLHSEGIVHLDIKPENILCFGNGVYKLADFAFSMKGETKKDGIAVRTIAVGTPGYIAPELADAYPVPGVFYPAEKLDVYSFAVTSYFAATGGSHPFRSSDDRMLYEYDRETFLENLNRQSKLPLEQIEALQEGFALFPHERARSTRRVCESSFA